MIATARHFDKTEGRKDGIHREVQEDVQHLT